MRWLLAVAVVAVLALLGWLASREVARSRAGNVAAPAQGDDGTPVAPLETPASPVPGKEEGCGEEEGGSLFRVKVVSRRDGSPIAGAQVFDGEQILRGVTGEDGTLEYRAWSDWWRASAPGYFSVNGGLDDDGSGWVALPPAALVTGRVFDAATGEGVVGAEIKLWAFDDGLGYERTTSGEGGRFEVKGALWQDFSIVVEAEGYAVTSYYAHEDLKEPLHDVSIGLAGGAILEGCVFDADGAPAPGTSVALKADGDWLPNLRARADEEGKYRLTGVPLGVEVTPCTTYEHYAGDPVVFRDAGDVQQRDIRFPARAFLSVTARDVDGKDVEISRMSLVQGGHDLSASRSEAGWGFAVPGGHYVLEVLPFGWPEQKRDVTLEVGRRRQEEFLLSGGLSIEGTVVSAEGSPLQWTVSWGNGTLFGYARADQEGHFRIDGLPAVPVWLEVDPWQQAFTRREGVVPGGPPVVLALQPAARIIGRVVDVANPRDLWTYLWCDSCSTSCDRMEDDGRFEFVVSYLGEPMVVAFRRTGDAPVVFSVPPLRSGEVRDLGEVRLDPGRDLHARILDAAGSPVAGARVELAEPWYDAPRPTRSDHEGRFCLFRVPSGPFRVRVDANGYPPHVLILGGDNVLRLSEGGVAEATSKAAFRLADVNDWVDNVSVYAEPEDGTNVFRARLQTGTHSGWIELPSGERVEILPVVIRDGETTKVEIKRK